MYKTKLLALNYPNKQFNIEDTKQVRSLVLWLEDQKIRYYKIEDRKGLRDIDSKAWDEHFATYLKDQVCPIMKAKLKEKLEWLIGYAVSLEYSDNVEKYRKQTSDIKKNETAAPKMVSSNPLDNLDFESPDFKNFVNDLAKMLYVTQHPDHLMTLQAVSKLVCERLNKAHSQMSSQEGDDNSILQRNMGIKIEDKNLNKAAKLLKLLYIQDLRDIQTKINETIVAVQNVTADPITDTKIGKVGY